MKPRLAIVSWNANRAFTPRGERTRVLAEALRSDWDVQVIGPAKAPPEAAARGRANPLRRRARRLSELVMLDKHEPWSKARFRRWRPDQDAALLIGYPFSPVSEAARALSKAGIPYVVDAGDPWVLTNAAPSGRLVGRRRSARAERRVWDAAAGAIVTTHGQARALSGLFPGLPTLVRPNGFLEIDPDRLPRNGGIERRNGDSLRIVHFGNLYEARIDVVALLETLRRGGRWARVGFFLYGSDWTGSLERLPDGIDAQLRTPVPWPAAVELAPSFDVALALGNRDPAQLPSKAVQYLTLPIPRLAITGGADDEALGEYVRDKPGWLALDAGHPELDRAVAEHLSRPWPAARLSPPAGESWPCVARQVARFLRECVGP